jgi:hypothetical protein
LPVGLPNLERLTLPAWATITKKPRESGNE